MSLPHRKGCRKTWWLATVSKRIASAWEIEDPNPPHGVVKSPRFGPHVSSKSQIL